MSDGGPTQAAVEQKVAGVGPDTSSYGPTFDPTITAITIESIPTVQTRWFNIGWYVAGKAFESWTSNGSPSTTPPSGHTLVDIQSFVIS